LEFERKNATEIAGRKKRIANAIAYSRSGYWGLREHTFLNSRGEIEERNMAAWRTAREWRITGPCLWISGATGTGKTYLAGCIGNAALDTGHTVGMLTGARLAGIAHAGYNRDEEARPWFKLDLLIIDDIHEATNGTDAVAVKLLREIIDTRYTAGRRTILTTNFTPGEVQGQLARSYREGGTMQAQALMSRLNLAGPHGHPVTCLPLELTGSNLRARPRNTQAAPEQTELIGE